MSIPGKEPYPAQDEDKSNCRPHRRPPWWPENEAWNPGGPPYPAWRSHRGRFFRRIGGLLALLFLLACSGFTLLTWLGAGVLGWIRFSPDGALLAIPVAGLALLLGILAAARVGTALRRTFVPVGDLIEAANRLAEGDYTVRVAERGPGEIHSLAHTFNNMVARLQSNEENRRRLLADVTHELRTPLSIIQGNLEGMIDGVYPADDAHLQSVLDESRMMSRLIEDLRTLSHVESGALHLSFEAVDLEALLENVISAFQVQADQAGVSLQLDCGGEIPEINADAERVRAVVENLVANALRYTPPGGSIQVACLYKTEERVEVVVRDTGRGIAAEDLPHIFDRFYKSSDSRGMGLGLAIAQSLIAAHGGQMSAESQPGQGTSIRFSLPTTRG